MPEDHSSTPIAPAVKYRGVAGHAGYRVGDDGSVWSCVITGGNLVGTLTDSWHELKPCRRTEKDRHLVVNLGRGNQRLVHHLVLEAFVGPCPEGMECRHKDGDPENNRATNLHWGTHTQNMEDKVKHGRSNKGEKTPCSVLTAPKVVEVMAMHRAGRSGRSIAACFGVHQVTISKITTGKTWNHVTGLPPFINRSNRRIH